VAAIIPASSSKLSFTGIVCFTAFSGGSESLILRLSFVTAVFSVFGAGDEQEVMRIENTKKQVVSLKQKDIDLK
jgi:hypothetical protein